MEWLAESYKAIGLFGGVFLTLSALVVWLVKYIIKSNESKNNVIANHISHQTETMNKHTEVLIDVHDSIIELRKDNKDMLTELQNVLRRLIDKL